MESESKIDRPYKRAATGRFSKGTGGGPGRPPHRSAAEEMFAVARRLNDPEHGARTTVELAREVSPALLRRVAERGLDPKATTRDVIECARLVLDRAYGKPVESVALAHADMNAPSAAERHQRAQAALARLREMFGRSAPEAVQHADEAGAASDRDASTDIESLREAHFHYDRHQRPPSLLDPGT